jgi:Ca2+-transporting ATPase
MLNMQFYDKTIEKTLVELNTKEEGLTEEEAKIRLKKYGPNEIKRYKKIQTLKIFLKQFKSPLILILIIATIISLFLKQITDSILISIILILNSILGFSQEYKAEKSIQALKKLAAPLAIVLRNNKKQVIHSEDLVPGDILLIEQGSVIPADARLIENYNLKVNESTLTGESTPVEKSTQQVKTTLIAEQTSMIFASTICVYGRAKAIVTSTGMNTELGKIAKEIEEEPETEIHLQKNISKLAKTISLVTILIALVILASGILRGFPLIEILLASISLAVAAIPEGLPAVITITLALGLQRMLKKNTLIRKLPATETLGSVTVIATDKTGTLTKNEMTCTEIYVNDKKITVTGKGYETQGKFYINKKEINPTELQQFLEIANFCHNADLPSLTGDPTELALIVAAKKSKLNFEENKRTRIQEIPFTSEKKYMATLYKKENKESLYVKGAPEVILDMCSKVYIDKKLKWLNSAEKNKILEKNNEMASRGLRVIALAYSKESDLKNLIFVGLAGIIDPPRPEVKDAIQKCKEAGVKVIMITGDHELTAKAIAHEVGIFGSSITGKQLDKLKQKQLNKIVEDISIYARVNPEHKVKILEALRSKNHIIAMTGDGINDAPALKKADIGIAVNRGTDVAKEASEMVLIDNNFSSIVSAIEEGRGIFSNIKKFVYYLLASNLGEVLTIFIAMLLALPLPLIAVQILWINLISDGPPALALSVEPIESDLMKRPPRKKDDKILDKKMIINLIFIGILITAGTLFIFALYNRLFDLKYAQTMAFTTLMMYEMFNVFNARSEKSIFKVKFFRNKKLIYAIVLSIILQILIIYVFTDYFKLVPLKALDWLWIILISSTILIFGEIRKAISKK